MGMADGTQTTVHRLFSPLGKGVGE